MTKTTFQLSIITNSAESERETVRCQKLLRSLDGNRQVYEAEWGKKQIILKLFSDKLRAGRHLRREWDGLELLKQKGLSSPRALFKGQTKDGYKAVAMEKIGESVTTLEAFNKTEDREGKLSLLLAVCKEVARQHNEGVLQKDLHLGNFLLDDDRVFAIDVAQMRFHSGAVKKRKGLCKIAMLMHPFLEANEEWIEKVISNYLAIRGLDFEKSDSTFFKKRLSASKTKGMRRGLKKILRTNKRQQRVISKGFAGMFEKEFCDGAKFSEFVRQVDLLMDEGEILKNGNTCYVSRLSWNGQNVVVKRYNYKGIIHSVRHTIKGSRARRCWVNAHRLLTLNVATPKPIAYFEKRRNGILWKSYLVTEYVAGQNLHTFLRDNNVTEQQRSIIIGQVEELLDRLGSYRITHGDLKHTNILITTNGPVLIDLDGMMVHRYKWTIKNKRSKDIFRFGKAFSKQIEKEPRKTQAN